MARNKKEEKLTDFLTQPSDQRRFRLPRLSQISTRSLLVGLAVLALLATGAAGYFYYQLNQANKDPNASSKAELQEIIEKVGKHVILPTDEQPTLATVTDPDKLRDQPFFANAKAGYKVLIYSNAKKAILYDPESDRVVEVAPINIGDQSLQSRSETEAQSSASAPADKSVGDQSAVDKSTVSVQVVNAARKSGLAGQVAERLRAAGYTKINTVNGATVETATTISYATPYQNLANEINGMFNNQAKVMPGASEGIFITLGTDFQL